MRTFWLASYPKSGNTWFRVFLSNLLFPNQSPVDPNRLPLNNVIASARSPFHEIIGVPPSLLTPDEYDSLRPEIDRIIGRDWSGPICVRKAHDAYTYLPDGRPLMSRGPDFAAIYILRNPWDVAVSAANHWNMTHDEAVELMCRDDAGIDNSSNRISTQLRQQLLSWSGHVESWLKAPLELCLVRYEDMHSTPLETFLRAVRFLGLQVTNSEVNDAIKASDFQCLQRIERERGFREAPGKRQFFRIGQVNGGRDLLSENNRRQLDYQHNIVRRLINQRFEVAI